MKKKALLVNDSKFESLVLRDMLNRLDYDVEIADEFDALYAIEQFSPDIVIVNYIMQDTKGDKLIQTIKSDQPAIKCLLSSSSQVKTEQFPEEKIDGILKTPVSMFALKDMLRRIDFKLEDSFMSSNEVGKRYCVYCNKEITDFGEQIVFCPFCGDELN